MWCDQNKANSYHRSSQCRWTQRWPQTTDTCHWLHTSQRAGTRTCHPNRAEWHTVREIQDKHTRQQTAVAVVWCTGNIRLPQMLTYAQCIYGSRRALLAYGKWQSVKSILSYRNHLPLILETENVWLEMLRYTVGWFYSWNTADCTLLAESFLQSQPESRPIFTLTPAINAKQETCCKPCKVNLGSNMPRHCSYTPSLQGKSTTNCAFYNLKNCLERHGFQVND